MTTTCARCQAPMMCQPEGGCWCMEVAYLPMPAAAATLGCLCRACLTERVEAACLGLQSGEAAATVGVDSAGSPEFKLSDQQLADQINAAGKPRV